MSRPVQLMIAGAQKAGTSSLKNYLGQHPGICTHEQIEMMYFVNDAEYEQGFARAFRRYFGDEQGEDRVIVAKSVGVLDHLKAMERLRDHNPGVHLVLSLRNPADRAYSAYWYARRMGWEDLETFEEAIEADPERFGHDRARQHHCAYLYRSLYAQHLANLLHYFSREQIHVFLMEEIRQDAVAVCRRLYGLFEGLDPAFEPHTGQRHNRAARPRSQSLARLTSSRNVLPSLKRVIRRLLPQPFVESVRDALQQMNERQFMPPPMRPETRARLDRYFAPHNAELSELLGRDLSHWC
jgi:hypothetical protein